MYSHSRNRDALYHMFCVLLGPTVDGPIFHEMHLDNKTAVAAVTFPSSPANHSGLAHVLALTYCQVVAAFAATFSVDIERDGGLARTTSTRMRTVDWNEETQVLAGFLCSLKRSENDVYFAWKPESFTIRLLGQQGPVVP